LLSATFFASLLLCSTFTNVSALTGIKVCLKYQCKEPTVDDPKLKVAIVYQGNSTSDLKQIDHHLFPVTKMAFLGYDDILLLGKNDGRVLRIVNHTVLANALLDVGVANKWERGLLGIAILKDAGRAYVFLYYTESNGGDGTDICPTIYCLPSATDPSNNKLYRYELKNSRLLNPKLLFSTPASNVASHIGGALEVGRDKNIYVIVGDFHGNYNKTTSTMALNFRKGGFPDGRAGILRFTPEGKAVGHGILGERYPLDLYYAYGIRNGYGFDFDPVSGRLWDTENGPEFGDEINLVEPGFNSGWTSIQGIWEGRNRLQIGKIVLNEPDDRLVNFGGKGEYSAPELVWNSTVAPTALRFLNSDKLGKGYENDLFVASLNLGQIYHFDLNENRTGLSLPPVLADKVVNTKNETQNVIFARGLGRITDIEVGPDGNLYILSSYFGKPTIFRISRIVETK